MQFNYGGLGLGRGCGS